MTRIATYTNDRCPANGLHDSYELAGPKVTVVKDEAWSKVDDAKCPVVSLENSLQDICILDVLLTTRPAICGRNRERTAIALVEELAEDGGRIEARHAAPHDRPGVVDEGRDLTIPNETKVLNTHPSSMACECLDIQ